MRSSRSRPARLRYAVLASAAALALSACSREIPVAPEAACAPARTLSLAPGEYAALTAAEAACVELAPHRGAEYVLAAFDARGVAAARTAAEPHLHDEVTYVLDHGAPDAARMQRVPVGNGAHGAAPPRDVRYFRGTAEEAGTDPFARRSPWQMDERFPVHRMQGTPAVARVVRVFPGVVFAVIDDEATSHASRLIGDTETAMEFLLREGFDDLVRAYGAARPVTSAGSGQLLVLFGAWDPAYGAGATWTLRPEGAGTAYSYVWMNLDVRPQVQDQFRWYDFPTYRLKVLAHELTHAWQDRYLAEAGLGEGSAWGAEGSADMMAMHYLRRFLGIGHAANWDWSGRLSAPNRLVAYALEPAGTRGRVNQGYFDASSMLRDLKGRMVRAGADERDALAELARGALEGWHGHDAGVPRPGIAGRVRGALGAGWRADEAVLLWTLTQALDDATSNPDLNNPAYRAAGARGAPYAWPAAADDVRLGAPFHRAFTAAGGASAFIRINDPGSGGVVSARSSHPDAVWMLARGR
jgi:hypothetical protein